MDDSELLEFIYDVREDIHQNRGSLARKRLEDALEDHPDSLQLGMELAKLEMYQGDKSAGQYRLLQLQEIHPDEPEIDFLLATAVYDTENEIESITRLNRIIAEDKNENVTAVARHYRDYYEENWQSLIGNLIDPDQFWTLGTLEGISLRRGKPLTAIRYIGKSIRAAMR